MPEELQSLYLEGSPYERKNHCDIPTIAVDHHEHNLAFGKDKGKEPFEDPDSMDQSVDDMQEANDSPSTEQMPAASLLSPKSIYTFCPSLSPSPSLHFDLSRLAGSDHDALFARIVPEYLLQEVS